MFNLDTISSPDQGAAPPASADPGANVFQQHGVRHLSASSINKWIEQPAAWVAHYLFGIKSASSSKMLAGNCAEDGVEEYLTKEGCSINDAIEIAQQSFNKRTFMKDDDYQSYHDDIIPAFVQQACEMMADLGTPETPEENEANRIGKKYQHNIQVDLGIQVPVTGYLDFLYPGLIVDLKTTGRLPNGASSGVVQGSWARQGAIYHTAHKGNYGMKFLVITPKKAIWLELDVAASSEAMRQVHQAARAIQNFLSLSDDKEELARLVSPNFDHMYLWKDPGLRAQAEKLFGL